MLRNILLVEQKQDILCTILTEKFHPLNHHPRMRHAIAEYDRSFLNVMQNDPVNCTQENHNPDRSTRLESISKKCKIFTRNLKYKRIYNINEAIGTLRI